MHRRVFAFDFDGTLAENGIVPQALQKALERLRTAGYALFLVTGRRYGSIALGTLGNVFTGIVWENGAVLSQAAANQVSLPFGTLDPRLIEALEAADVPLEHGRAIVATWTPHGETVRRVLNVWGGEAMVVQNKGALMILPAGTAKGAGLERLMQLCGYSPRNLVAFGDAENDLSLLELSEFGVAVADAVPTLKAAADLVMTQPGPAGVLEALDMYWLKGHAPNAPMHGERRIPLGEDEAGVPVSLPGGALASGNLGVFGDSFSGKSWVTGLLIEGMHHAGYQILVIDPEGDFRGLRDLPNFVAIVGDQQTLPEPASVVGLLETGTVSAVLDLSMYPVSKRVAYMAKLLRALRHLKEHMFRPHWIVMEEAQDFLQPNGNPVLAALQPMLASGGWAFVSYRPDQLAGAVLAALNHHLLTHLSAPKALQTVGQALRPQLKRSPSDTPPRHVLLSGQYLVRLRSNSRRVGHIRHLYKYFDTPLPEHQRFYFHNNDGFVGRQAASLYEFLQCLRTVPVESLTYHGVRGDFAAWAESTLGDGELATQLHKLTHRPLCGETLRETLVQRVAARHLAVEAMR
jgi:hydroxymethylpyrimidine pyrophosphatase-like HAD family hydrolase